MGSACFKGRKLSHFIAFPLFIAAVFITAFLFREQLWDLFSSPEKIRNWVSDWGAKAPLLFIGLQLLQVIVSVIPGEIPQIAGGYLFGVWLGILYSLIGITLGSAFNYYLARLLGRPFVRSILKKERLEKFENFARSKKVTAAFLLLFLVPAFPKDTLCYVAGITPMRFFPFLLISTAGRLPGIIGSAVMGDAAAEKRWLLAGIIFGAGVVLLVVGFFFRDRLRKLVERITNRGPSDRDGR
jgi:uncharacterized membrane protein YdjX (TVP38/TMEM64 family)